MRGGHNRSYARRSADLDDTIFVSVDKKAIEALPEEDQKKKEIQLNLTAKKALDELAGDIDETTKSNLSFESNSPSEPNNTLKGDIGDAALLSAP